MSLTTYIISKTKRMKIALDSALTKSDKDRLIPDDVMDAMIDMNIYKNVKSVRRIFRFLKKEGRLDLLPQVSYEEGIYGRKKKVCYWYITRV